MTRERLGEIQEALRAANVDGWLLTDFRGSNAPARRILGVPACSRRWWYWMPSQGSPVKLEPSVEAGVLAALPGGDGEVGGEVTLVARMEQVDEALRPLVAGKVVAMEYSPGGMNPYVSMVDAGTVERVRTWGAQVVSSQDLLQLFDARWSAKQWESHVVASRALMESFDTAVAEIAEAIRRGKPLTEFEVTARCAERLRGRGMLVEHLNTSVNANTALPHYDPTEGSSLPVASGSLVLMDHFCRLDREVSAYADYTRVYYLGRQPPAEMTRAFDAVVAAREAVVGEVESACRAGRSIRGMDLDLIARHVLIEMGYEKHIAHRTGHNLGTAHVHGNGAHLDAVEHPDDRILIPRTAFTIEPGLYFPGKFGVRTEINVYLDESLTPHITGHRPDHIELVEV